MSMPKIIFLISGKRKSGKDYISEKLLEKYIVNYSKQNTLLMNICVDFLQINVQLSEYQNLLKVITLRHIIWICHSC